MKRNQIIYLMVTFCGYLLGLGIPLIVLYAIDSIVGVTNGLAMKTVSFSSYTNTVQLCLYLCFQSIAFCSVATYSLTKYLNNRKKKHN
jgi:hypothetical protein